MTPASDRINAAHTRLLAALQPTEDQDSATINALLDVRVDVMGTTLARLLGALVGEASFGKPVRVTRLAELVERALAEGEKHTASAVARRVAWEATR